MKPGRELDALIAEKVMGWKNIAGEQHWLAGINPYGGLAEDVPYYSTDIAAAWDIVEKLKGEGGFILEWDGGWYCRFSTDKFDASGNPQYLTFDVMADTGPHAICLAALEAVGIHSGE